MLLSYFPFPKGKYEQTISAVAFATWIIMREPSRRTKEKMGLLKPGEILVLNYADDLINLGNSPEFLLCEIKKKKS